MCHRHEPIAWTERTDEATDEEAETPLPSFANEERETDAELLTDGGE